MMTSNRPPERRERKKLQTRGAILAAGQQLFAERAMESISIDEIVAAADVSKGSFYNHFEDKHLEFNIEAANRDIKDPAERVARALGVLLTYGLSHPERVQALLSLSERRTRADSTLNSGLAADLKNGLAQKRFVGIDLETGVLLVVGTFVVVLRHVALAESETPVATLAIKMGAALLRGLGVAAAEADDVARHAADTLHYPVQP
jgi:AcrR family transcriptional regulator